MYSNPYSITLCSNCSSIVSAVSSNRVRRGGSFANTAPGLLSSFRFDDLPSDHSNNIGARREAPLASLAQARANARASRRIQVTTYATTRGHQVPAVRFFRLFGSIGKSRSALPRDRRTAPPEAAWKPATTRDHQHQGSTLRADRSNFVARKVHKLVTSADRTRIFTLRPLRDPKARDLERARRIRLAAKPYGPYT
jgi:hypothetical protein